MLCKTYSLAAAAGAVAAPCEARHRGLLCWLPFTVVDITCMWMCGCVDVWVCGCAGV